jgi:hypothetical protein
MKVVTDLTREEVRDLFGSGSTSPQSRERNGNAWKQRWADPAWRAKFLAGCAVGEKRRRAAKAQAKAKAEGEAK